MDKKLLQYLPTQEQVDVMKKSDRELWVSGFISNPGLSRKEQTVLLQIFTEMCITADQNRAELEKIQDSREKKRHTPGRFKPGKGGSYCAIHERCLDIEYLENLNQDHTDRHIALGICCETEKEAEFVRDQKAAYLELIDKIKELNKGWRVDWKDENQKKYFLRYNRKVDEIIISLAWIMQDQRSELAAKTEAICAYIICEFGSEKICLAMGWSDYEES